MPRVDVVVETEISRSARAKQLEGMFDVPASERARLEWKVEAPIEAKPWSVGLIVGPSGAGKTACAQALFPKATRARLRWHGASVVDDFAAALSIEEITAACQSVGFGTIPAWLRPYKVLSTGEKFRVELARRILELPDPIVVDEFSSVVDRQVAKVASHAVAKYVRKKKRQLVAVSCHFDVIDWLQPDWIFEPARTRFRWRSLQPRPTLSVEIHRVAFTEWQQFARFHYLTPGLMQSAQCFIAYVDGTQASFTALLYRPINKARKANPIEIRGFSRTVTLPDWQGLGLAMHLGDTIASALAAMGRRARKYPAHPHYVRALDRSPRWALVRPPGVFRVRQQGFDPHRTFATVEGRANAIFEYIGPAMASEQDARDLWEGRASAVCEKY